MVGDSEKPKQSNELKLSYNYKKGDLSSQLKDFYLPILSICVFVAIVFFFSIPQVQNTKGLFEKKDQKNDTLEKKRIELKDLERLREENQQNSELLAKLDRIIPTEQTDVVEFQDKVASLAFDNIIEIKDQKIGERFLLESQDGKKKESEAKNLTLIRITTDFSLVGEIDDFRNMLSDIYGASDFIVISQMELANPRTGSATMEITLSKYQYQNPFRDDPTGEQEKKFLDTLSYKEQIDKSVVDFIERKSRLSEYEYRENTEEEY
jgi:Tfp pilus assembly protein PilO